MSEVRALSFSQKQCGRHVSDTKKRFVWIFQIDGKNYTLELINSALSGKRTVLLNMDQIYHEKNLLNIDFQFTHMIDGHSFRIFRTEDKINNFQLRIDNRTFDEVRLGRNKTQKSTSSKQYAKKSNDPFAEFQSFTSNQTSKQNKSNAFGDFDFEAFSKPIVSQLNKIQQKPVNLFVNNNSSLLDFGQASKKQTVAVNDFQTNVFATKSNNQNNFSDFAQSFKQNENNLLDINQNQFSTNAYVNRNHYMDLHNNNQAKSDRYLGDDVPPPVEQKKQKSIWQNFGQYKESAGLATKKAINTAAIKINQMKKNVKDYADSLI